MPGAEPKPYCDDHTALSGPSYCIECADATDRWIVWTQTQREIQYMDEKQLLVDTRRSALLEAARAMCDHCEQDVPEFDDDEGLYRHSDEMECKASRIHERLNE